MPANTKYSPCSPKPASIGPSMAESSDVLLANGISPFVSGVESATSAGSSNPYSYVGKELIKSAGVNVYDFGPRQMDFGTGRFGAQDLCAEDYFPTSQYMYCAGNPVMFTDPTGMDALRIVDEDAKTITVRAKYYVVSMDIPYRNNGEIDYVPGYKDSDLSDMTSYNDYLNGLNLTVKEGPYKGYSVKFDLSFESTESPGSADIDFRNVVTEDNHPYGNTIHRANAITGNKYKFYEINNLDGSTSTVGGVTSHKHNIIMNYGYDNKMNILHEIFHTFGLDHPIGGAADGIMHYPPEKPNTNDAYNISITPLMPTIKKK